MNDDDLVMSVEAAAKALHISRNLAYEAARDGRLPCIRIGRRLLVSRCALEKLLEEPQPLNPTLAGK
jgi:excisionase family DNA binding protein